MSTPTPCPDQLTLYVVAWTDDDGDSRYMFVTARNKLEAFALWRIRQGIDPKEFRGEDILVGVYDTPAPAGTPMVHHWGHATSEHFAMDLETLATRAVEAATPVIDHDNE